MRARHCGPSSTLAGRRTTKPVGAPGFEPGTSPTRTVRATRLRHAPRAAIISERGAEAVPPPAARAATLREDPVPVGDDSQAPPDPGSRTDGGRAGAGACLPAPGLHRRLAAE